MVQVPTPTLTLEAFLQLPETKPASEYIDGQVIQKPMPQGKHSKLQGKLVTVINQAVEAPKLALAFPELRWTFGGRSIVPDVSVFVWNHIPTDEQGNVANVFPICPDWAIAILSREHRFTQVTNNLLHGLQHGCQMGWLIDPEEAAIVVYPAGQQPEFFEGDRDLLPVPAFAAAVHLTLSDVWGWLKL